MSRILVAEDEAVLRMLITDSLEDEGYEIDSAVDGREAFDMMEAGQYDLLIVDHMMPRMTGLELINAVKDLPGREQLQIMMLSAKSQVTDREKAMAAGADVFLSKPFSPIELVRIVGEMLHE
ncbi:response regulator [Paenibacillus sp. J5C_2022]|uniref:response regulator n=1 Tax=Paenibacillus sp. J5C2022 TaxID=2977129 RepID=UPI0021D06175|nr:response regulator [Paenibacillus sp. J5C2022]MCU6707252.1 response regulator [Paenibacillus sp. J5C2022]